MFHHTFQKLPDEHCRIANDSSAFQSLFTLVKTPGLFPVFPIYPGDLPAEDTSMVFGYFLLESFQNFMGVGPHLWVLLLILRSATEPESHNRKRPDNSAADFSISSQPPTEGTHGFYDLVVFLSQFLLPDRKNGLTSMKPLHHHQLDGLTPHLFFCHFSLLNSYLLDGLPCKNQNFNFTPFRL
jgi:hypothetical protein